VAPARWSAYRAVVDQVARSAAHQPLPEYSGLSQLGKGIAHGRVSAIEHAKPCITELRTLVIIADLGGQRLANRARRQPSPAPARLTACPRVRWPPITLRASMGRMPNDHNPPGGISSRLVSFSADCADPPGLNDYDSFAEGYAASNETSFVHAYYERPAMLALTGDAAGRRILDAGCGSGPLFAALRDRGAIVTGIDKSAGMLAQARRRLGDDADLQVAELGRPLLFPDDTFDDVTASLVLHYLEDWGQALAELRRVLKPGGRLIVSVNHPFAENLWHREAGLKPDYLATYNYTVEWTAGGQSAVLRFWHRPLHAMTDAFTAAGFRIMVISEPPVAPDTPRELLPLNVADRQWIPGFLFFVLRAT